MPDPLTHTGAWPFAHFQSRSARAPCMTAQGSTCKLVSSVGCLTIQEAGKAPRLVGDFYRKARRSFATKLYNRRSTVRPCPSIYAQMAKAHSTAFPLIHTGPGLQDTYHTCAYTASLYCIYIYVYGGGVIKVPVWGILRNPRET